MFFERLSNDIPVQNRIFTAEALRTQRKDFLFGGEIPPNKKVSVLSIQDLIIGTTAIEWVRSYSRRMEFLIQSSSLLVYVFASYPPSFIMLMTGAQNSLLRESKGSHCEARQ